MTRKRTRAQTPYTAEEMFALVADVARYPEFIPYCVGLRVVTNNVSDGSGSMTTDMIVAYKVFREQFRSHVRLDKPALAIDVEYMDGPFHHLDTFWRFEDEPSGGSIVDFAIAFEFRNIVLQKTAQQVFERAFLKMCGAFVDRAQVVYGPRDQGPGAPLEQASQPL